MGHFTRGEVKKCFNFAKSMINKHRPDFKGGPGRDDKEIFYNDIQGKLAEIAVKNELKRMFPNAKIEDELDFNIYDRGIWDTHDLLVNNKYLSIKSVKHFSVVLMIECTRFNLDGSYSYRNNNNEEIINDYYILVKLKIEPMISWEDLNRDFKYFSEPFLDLKKKNLHIKRTISYDLAGFISHNDFWNKKLFIPKGTIITGRNMMEYLMNGKFLDNLPDIEGEGLKVDNYGIHCDALSPINDIVL